MVLESFLQAKVSGQNADHSVNSKERLTSRQQEIVQLLAEGKSSKEAAVVLDLSTKTIEAHRAHIMKRLGCHSISDVVRYAVRNNIIRA